MQVTDFLADPSNGLGTSDHLGVHVERDVKDEVLGMLAKMAKKSKVVVDVFEDVHAEHEIEGGFWSGGEEILVVKAEARFGAFLTERKALG